MVKRTINTLAGRRLPSLANHNEVLVNESAMDAAAIGAAAALVGDAGGPADGDAAGDESIGEGSEASEESSQDDAAGGNDDAGSATNGGGSESKEKTGPANHRARLREMARREREKREAKQSEERPPELPDDVRQKLAEYERLKSRSVRDQFLEDPAGFFERHGIAPRDGLQTMTDIVMDKDGAIQKRKNETEIQAVKRMIEEDRESRRAEEERRHQAEAAERDRKERDAFSQMTRDAEKYAILSVLDPEDVVDSGSVLAYQKHQAGESFDLGTIASELEESHMADLAKLGEAAKSAEPLRRKLRELLRVAEWPADETEATHAKPKRSTGHTLTAEKASAGTNARAAQLSPDELEAFAIAEAMKIAGQR